MFVTAFCISFRLQQSELTGDNTCPLDLQRQLLYLIKQPNGNGELEHLLSRRLIP
jgi:hypothetical protein